MERMIRGFIQLLSLVRPYSGHLLRVLVLQLLILLFTLPQPWLIKHLIDKGTVYENYPVAATIAALILLIVLTGILFFLAEYSLVVIANTICYHLRRGFYNHVQGMSYSFFDQWRVGDLFARYKEVSVVLPQVLVGVGAALGDLLAVLVYGGLIIYINPPISLMIVVAAAASTALMVPLARLLHRSIRARARQIGKVAGIVIEFLGGMKVIQAMRAEAVSSPLSSLSGCSSRLYSRTCSQRSSRLLTWPIISSSRAFTLGWAVVVTGSPLSWAVCLK